MCLSCLRDASYGFLRESMLVYVVIIISIVYSRGEKENPSKVPL